MVVDGNKQTIWQARAKQRLSSQRGSLLAAFCQTTVIVVVTRGYWGIWSCFHLYDLLLKWPVRQWLGFTFNCFHNWVSKKMPAFSLSLVGLLYPLTVCWELTLNCISHINYPSLLNKEKLSPDFVVFSYGAEVAAAWKKRKVQNCCHNWQHSWTSWCCHGNISGFYSLSLIIWMTIFKTIIPWGYGWIVWKNVQSI